MFEEFLKVATEAAQAAGKLQMSKLGDKLNIEFKGDINLVTEVDKACEALIIEKIQSQFPTHDILAEEGGGERLDSDYKWIIDPLDGTTNYAHGYPLFCTSIALEHMGEIVLGVIYEPNLDELFHAIKGQGSYLNGKPIHVSPINQLIRSLVVTGFAYNVQKAQNNNVNHFENMLMQTQAVRRDGVAAIDLCYVACGRYDGFWELNLFPWDVAAGSLLVTEAGGRVSDFQGNPFSVYDKEILVSNSQVHDEMIQVLQGE